MEIITRGEAITLQYSRYFSGLPCKRGHISERYCVNAACIECLHPKFEKLDIVARKAARRRIYVVKTQMERLKISIHTLDLGYFKSIIHGLCTLREPGLKREDILTKFKARYVGGNVFIHAFKVFPEDIDALIQIKLDLDWARLSPEAQARVIEAQERRRDGWVPPPLRTGVTS